MVPSEYFFNG